MQRRRQLGWTAGRDVSHCQRQQCRQTRAGIVAYFALAIALRLATFGWYDLYTEDAIVLSLILAPVYMAGIWVGSRFFKGASETMFRRVVIVLVLITGTVALVK